MFLLCSARAKVSDNLAHYARIIEADLGIAVNALPGGGAAGGLGAGLVAFMPADLRPGLDIVAKALGLDAIVASADLVITGEGRIDSQSMRGKAPVGVAALANRHGKPVIVVAGALGYGAEMAYSRGIDAMFSVIQECCTIEVALAQAAENVQIAARNVAAAIKIGRKIQQQPMPEIF
nr:glycerate kinase [Sphingobium boeckii]